MGTTLWSDRRYREAAAERFRTDRSAFAHDEDIRQRKTKAGVHPTLDPKRFTDGIREARDSEDHPCTTPIVVLFDVTGSMATVPRIVQERLCSLMGLCMRRGFVDHPAVLVGGIGDATCDLAPLQIGQFESGNEIETDLGNLYLESGGGGGCNESYELGLYFLARKTKTDHLEKRGKKGYAFFIGDEIPYSRVSKRQVQEVFGDTIPRDIRLKTILKEAQQNYEIFSILPRTTAHYDNPKVIRAWRSLLGRNALRLKTPLGISELIASLVGLSERSITPEGLDQSLRAEGTQAPFIEGIHETLRERELRQ